MTSSESLSSPSPTSDSEPSKSPSPTISRRGKRRRSLSPRTDEFGRERDRRSSSRSQGSPSHRSRRRESLSPRRSRNSEESQRTDRGKEHQRATSSRRRNEERAPENIQWGRQQQDQEAKRRRLAEFERVPGYQPELLGVSEDGDEEPQEKQKPNYNGKEEQQGRHRLKRKATMKAARGRFRKGVMGFFDAVSAVVLGSFFGRFS